MDSYNLFGDDGSGMLEGLTDLGGSDGFANTSTSNVATDNKDTTDSSYRQSYSQGGVAQENTIQKLASFGAGGGGGMAGNAQTVPPQGTGPPAPEYHEYGAYPPRPRLPQPPHSALHPTHHGHPTHSYPGYHPGPDPMYGIPDHPGIGDMGVWTGGPGPNRYAPMTPTYRHAYDHQQKMHQYPPQQGPGLGAMQSQNGAYMPRQPHFPQPPSQSVYGQQQNYPNYAQMHPPATSRISQHPSYHQQMDVSAHQYGLPHSQQSHGAIPQHQPHQSMTGHPGGLGSGLQGHPHHLHHPGGPPLHHASRQQGAPPSSVSQTHPVPSSHAVTSHSVPPSHGGPASHAGPPSHPGAPSHPVGPPHPVTPSHPVASQMPYGSPHHNVSINYQPHQVQHPLDVNVANQYNPQKTGLDNGSPQYRPPFHQISPQVSPRAQMSPRQPAQPQSSPRPVMSPVKGPSASPHSRNSHPTPVSAATSNAANAYGSQNTLQALEQMVLPGSGTDYPFQRNPSPAMSHVIPPPQWNQNKPSNVTHTENIETNETTGMTTLATDTNMMPKPVPHVETKTDKPLMERDKPAQAVEGNETRQFLQPADVGNGKSENTSINISTANNSMSSGIANEFSDTQRNLGLCDATKPPEEPMDDTRKESSKKQNDSSEHSLPLNQYSELTEKENNEILNKESLSASPITTLPNDKVPISTTQSLPANVPTSEATSLQISAPADRNQVYSNASAQSITAQNIIPHGNTSNLPGNLPPNMQSTTVQTPFQNSLTGTPPNQGSSGIQSGVQLNLMGVTPVSSLPHSGIPSSMQSNIPVHNPPAGLPCLPVMPNMQQSAPSSLPSNASPNVPNVPMPMPMGVQNIHPAMPPNLQGNQPNVMPNMQHNMNPNMMMMGSGSMPLMPGSGLYGIPHHQERSALQQQIQEIYCLPPSAENQEKVRCLQERLAILQQHETADKCNGGPNCILQNPGYSKMVESPQVTSTTGRGRGKGPPRPRKPRAKKEKPVSSITSLDQLPVSEDCVTAGTGLPLHSEVDVEQNEEATNLDSSIVSLDGSTNEITKNKKGPKKNKERKPRAPKEPKVAGEKPVKERKKREPKDPTAPKKKRNAKKDGSEVQADTTTNYENLDKSSTEVNICETVVSDQSIPRQLDLTTDSVTDFDDIPVSKIAIKDLLEEAEAKRGNAEMDEDFDMYSPSPKKKSSKKRASGGSSRKIAVKKVPCGKRKKRGGIVPDSDGEPDDLVKTPPPSPPQEGECDSLKRRSGRHAQRKKYTDDVMLRLSDDEFNLLTTPKREKDCKPEELQMDSKDGVKIEGARNKPNFMYVNTTDEDAMIVQHVLACRMGKRELKSEVLQRDLAVETIDVEPSEVNIAEGEEETKPEVIEKEDSSEDIKDKTEEVKQEITTDNPETIPDVHEKDEPTEDKNDTNEPDKPPVIVDVEEYYVKYRNFSYLHCEWKTEEELYKGDKRIFSKIKRFKQKQAQQLNIFELLDDEPFNPDYVEVERILDVSETTDPANKSVVKHYLVKWKGLQYEDSTWELEEDVDIDKISQFKIFAEIPPKDKWKYKKRPPTDNWVQLKESPLYKAGNTLRPYQLEGLNWLLFSWHNNRNCILADEMGLGKTIQSLTFVNSVWEYGIRGPFLIIAPLSTIPNWQREFEGWTDMNVIVYHGSQQSKSMLQEYEFYFKNENGEPIREVTKFNVLITTFEMIVTDFQELKTFNWRVCVIDEAHRLKNRNCKLLDGLRQLHLEHRVLLSGTPLQNNVNELFSLLNFLEPSQFASNEAFLSEFGQLKTESEVNKLQALLKPMMLRRLKEDVEKSLAPKEETIIEVELTNIQKKYYRAILERNFSFLQKGTGSAANIPNLMNTMMELRKCCIHPYLLNGAEDQIQFDYRQSNGEDKEAYYKALIQSSGKMVLVDKLLPKLKSGGHRVLIFSQMVRCLDILEDYLVFRKYPFERIDGRIRGNLRQEAIDRFSKPDSDRFVFLLCTKAGGLGINLTAADTVIIYDSDWNPQNDLQAQARCHRIGQQKMVKIYRLVCRNTYEREMFDKASLKLGLDKAILQSMNTTQGKETGLRQMSKKEIEDLLKKGAYGAVMDDDAGDQFCEEDIEMILARRTQIIQMESEKGSTFSKASFAAANQRSDIDIRDPDFWNKWAKKAEIDTTEKKEDEDLIVTEPRKRTVIKRYGHDDGTMEMSDMEATPDSDEDEEGISLRSKRKKDKLGRKGRKYGSDDYIPRHEGVPVDEEVVYGSWTRSECFKIERGLLTFGWARWDEIIDKNQFRKGWTIPVIEDCARIIALYCLRHYKGDEKIRNFIWDLIEPCENGEVTISRNHSGLHNPVPRGRNAKKKNKPRDIPKLSDIQRWEDSNHWSSADKYDCEAYLESSYKKHLFRHANKVLLRIRMMYYIKHEVIGDYATQIENGVHAGALGMRVPRGVDSAPPRLWWDAECDVSLLVGTYVHGYENYLAMRSDPQLCYVDKLGPPDDAECTDIKSEERKVRGAGVGDEDCTDDVSSGAGATSPAPSPRPEDDPAADAADPPDPADPTDPASHQWPSMQDLNTRLRRLITAYQRNYKREELKMQQKAKMERRERLDQFAREEASQWRWSRADEEAFRRTVASYGVEFDPTTKSLRWGRFRSLARLDAKSDDALTDYLKAFMAMCKRQCGLSVGEAELPTRADLKAEPIGEERAIATLERIDLLRVLREEVAPHGALEARLARAGSAATDCPPWWAPAAHDKLLVRAVCRHGLGDTYHKLFLDPKLPFLECSKKYYAANKGLKSTKSEPQKESSDDEDGKASEDASYEPRMSLRRSKRTSNTERDSDPDALSELESLAALGREEPPPQSHWFTERALETRLHHIAHAVQNSEWDAGAAASAERRHKRHIAIDVETERAKLHALLSPRDDASSDSGSRRSTPAPPPAHQRAEPAPAPDACAPLDLSEAHDLSAPRRAAPAASASAPAAAPRRLDDTLSRLMKRKNVPVPEQVVGKEKKRKKLDEIVLGLSAAKSQSPLASSAPSPRKSTPVLPSVSVTPVAPPGAAPAAHSAQKPFSVTVTNVPSPQSTPKELSSFLQQSLEMSGMGKSSSKSHAPPVKSFSHEAKVNKWLAEQASVDARRRSMPPRLSPDEHVPVVHRVTGKRIVGSKAPQLKHLAQWIAENPMYDIDSKWTEGIKEHVKLPQDVRSQRHSPMQPSGSGERKKGRPPTLDSPSSSVLSSSHLNQSLAGLNPALLASLSAFDPKALASTLSNLTGFDPKMLSSFDPKLLSSLSSFDPKNNPLLNSFNSMPNLLGGNLFANLAGLGLPGLSSLDMSSLGGAGSSMDNKGKQRKPDGGGSSSSKASNSQYPFVFPNPNMLYPQLGLGGLNPFGMHSGLTSAYDALGLLSSSLAATSGTSTMHSSSHSSRSSTKTSSTPKTSTVVTSSATQSRQQKASTQSNQMPQIFLPPDTFLLESLSKQSLNYEALLKGDKKTRESESHEATDLSKVEKKKTTPYDALRSQLPPEFAAVQEKLLKGDKKDIDISKMLLEQMASGALSASLVSAAEGKKLKETDPKDLYEKMSRGSEYLSRPTPADDNLPSNSSSLKRPHEEMASEPENLSLTQSDSKKFKESSPTDMTTKRDNKSSAPTHTGEMDLEDLIAPSTVIKTGVKAPDFDSSKITIQEPVVEKIDKPLKSSNIEDDTSRKGDHEDTEPLEGTNKAKKEGDSPESNSEDPNGTESARRGSRKGGRKTSEEGAAAPAGPRRELRSSSGRHSTDTM